MKPYINFNTQKKKRKEATNENDQNYFKLLNNAYMAKQQKI